MGRYREDVILPNGAVVRLRPAVVLGSKHELPTKRLAERRMEVLLARINDYSYRPGRYATVEEFAERWKTEVVSKRKASTIHTYESHLKKQILPALGRFRLDELGTRDYQSFVTRLSGTVSRKMLLCVVGTLSSMLRTAKNWSYVCEEVKFDRLVFPERQPSKPARTFTPEQAKNVMALAKPPYRVMFAIAAMTGLRVGEILALQTSDFDFGACEFHIRRSVWRSKVSSAKTANSEAKLPIPAALVPLLRAHIETIPEGYLFLNSRGNLFIAENVVRQGLTPVLDALNIPRCGFHAFRHLHSSMLLAAGAPATVTQAQMRHADPRVTLGIYGHVIGDAHRDFVNEVASILDSNGLSQDGKPQRIQ